MKFYRPFYLTPLCIALYLESTSQFTPPALYLPISFFFISFRTCYWAFLERCMIRGRRRQGKIGVPRKPKAPRVEAPKAPSIEAPVPNIEAPRLRRRQRKWMKAHGREYPLSNRLGSLGQRRELPQRGPAENDFSAFKRARIPLVVNVFIN